MPAEQVRPGLQVTLPMQQGWPAFPQSVGATQVIVMESQVLGDEQAGLVMQQGCGGIPHVDMVPPPSVPGGGMLQNPSVPQPSPGLHVLPAQHD